MSEVGDEWWWAGKEQGSEKLFHSLARVKMTNNEIASIVFHISKEELLLKDMFYLCKWRNEPKACLMTIRFMKKRLFWFGIPTVISKHMFQVLTFRLIYPNWKWCWYLKYCVYVQCLSTFGKKSFYYQFNDYHCLMLKLVLMMLF